MCVYCGNLYIISSSHAITADLTVLDTAKAAEFFLSDAIVITGSTTGDPPKEADVAGESRKNTEFKTRQKIILLKKFDGLYIYRLLSVQVWTTVTSANTGRPIVS